MTQVIVVSKRTAWQQRQLNTELYENHSEESLRRMQESHMRHIDAFNRTLDTLDSLDVVTTVIEGAESLFTVYDATRLVITVGGDGTLLAASHHVPNHIPMLGVNSDPVFSVGHFCGCTIKDVEDVIAATITTPDRVNIRKTTRMKVLVNDAIVADRILNEALFSHSCPAAMTRFTLNGIRYACSGVWLGTGAGSTGALASAGGIIDRPDSQQLQAIIREPWDPDPFSKVQPGNQCLMGPEFTLINKTVDATLYFDGPFLKTTVGFDQRIQFLPSEQFLSIVYSLSSF